MKPYAHQLRGELVATSRFLHDRGWVANHDGNVTARLDQSRFLATPTSVSKGDVDENMLIVVNEKGRRVAGHMKPFSELVLHLAAYRARSDVNAVIHAHPPFATAFAVAGRELACSIIAEAVVSLGAKIPLVPYARPGTGLFVESLEKELPTYDAVLLENHGVITVGDNLEQARLRMELVEHLACIQWRAHQIGTVQKIPEDDVGPLLEKRAQAGLGPVSRGGLEPWDRTRPSQEAHDLRSIIAQELRALEKER